jgi:fibronectin-binding autotransporter adhesin
MSYNRQVDGGKELIKICIKNKTGGWKVLCRIAFLALLITANMVQADDNYWPVYYSYGDWSDGDNWSLGVPPSSSDDAYVDWTSVDITSYATCADLYLDQYQTGQTTVNLMNGGNLSVVNDEWICGIFNHNGGTNSANYLGIGGTGTYNLSNGQLTIKSNVFGGEQISGKFNQYGGINSTYGLLVDNGIYTQNGGTNNVAPDSGGTSLVIWGGGYNLNNGYLTTSNFEAIIGGYFKQGGGTHTVNGSLQVNGTYQLGAGQLTVNGSETMNSTFAHSGGKHNVSGSLGIGTKGNSGYYTLSASGELSVSGGEVIGSSSSSGTFNQYNSTTKHTTNSLLMYSGSSYNLLNGQLTVNGNETIGGSFYQDDGTHTVNGNMTVGPDISNPGIYSIKHGSLSAKKLDIGAGGIFSITNADALITVSDSFIVEDGGQFYSVPGGVIHMTGSSFVNKSTHPDDLAGLSNLTLIFEGGENVVDTFELAYADIGGAGNNFALGELILGGTAVSNIKFVDDFDNNPGSGVKETLYVTNLILNQGSSLDLNGMNLYYESLTNLGGTILLDGGNMIQIPEPVTFALFGLGILAIRRRNRR